MLLIRIHQRGRPLKIKFLILTIVNMGAALDTRTIKETIKKPYGPVIGFCSQFLIMPLVR